MTRAQASGAVGDEWGGLRRATEVTASFGTAVKLGIGFAVGATIVGVISSIAVLIGFGAILSAAFRGLP